MMNERASNSRRKIKITFSYQTSSISIIYALKMLRIKSNGGRTFPSTKWWCILKRRRNGEIWGKVKVFSE